ncbi:AAA family ATPase [Thermodesulfovibrio sp. 3907-1M]|uniref:AAA family ATPase n=1 Tax=Thermodesulfovibrio autotrophicus TaxID=3118333 RepID=A0AAU8GX91_9BACT
MEYFEFYKLKEDPFGITPDPDFFYPSKSHMEALESIKYLIQKGEGFMLVTGYPGTGKTTLIRKVLRNFKEENILPVVIYNSSLTPQELLKGIIEKISAEDSSIDLNKFQSKLSMVEFLSEYLRNKKLSGYKNLLIIDEAQDMPEETLTEIKHLSNIETEKEKLIQIILFAQPYFEDILSKPKYSQINQRISLKVRLSPLTKEEVGEYINFRLKSAVESPVYFKKSAIRRIYKASKGIPRVINLICSRALMVGYIKNSYKIKKSYVKFVLKHLHL